MTKKNNLSAYKSNHEKNWYYQKDNFDNWKALRAIDEIEDFITGNYPDVIKAIDLINLTHKQNQFLIDHADNPQTVLTHFAALPLSVQQLRLFYAMLLKWQGGTPIFNPDKKERDILLLVENEFSARCEGQDVPEKDFARADKKVCTRIAGELSKHTSKLKYNIHDRYFKIAGCLIDFENLPVQIIREGIVEKFAQEDSFNPTGYSAWEKQLFDYLKQINANKYALSYLRKAIAYGKLVLQFHDSYECSNPSDCNKSYSWQRRIEITERILEKIEESLQTSDEGTLDKHPEFTTARQVLAMHYLFEYCQIKNVDNTAKARFVQFMTGKETGAKSISNTTIYKRVIKPLSTDNKTLKADLQYIRKYFEDLGLNEIAKMITNEISKSEE